MRFRDEFLRHNRESCNTAQHCNIYKQHWHKEKAGIRPDTLCVVLGFPVGNVQASTHVSVSDVCQRGRLCERILDRTAFFQGQN
jgi:hypothetical protein